jgi:adenylosuccinate lyase
MSEHLVTLARLVRASAGVILEGTVQSHERDGRSWKAEWVAFPEACLLTGAALELAQGILNGLQVREEAMRANLGDRLASEKVLSLLAPLLGKHRAQMLLHRALAEGREAGRSLVEAIAASDALRRRLDPQSLHSVIACPDPGAAPRMSDEVVARGWEERSREPEVWP